MLPAREFPLDEAGTTLFRRNYRNQFEGDLQRSLIYQEVSEGRLPGGLEYYLPLFFEQTATLFDYLPENRLLMIDAGVREQAEAFFQQVEERFAERPPRHRASFCYHPQQLYLSPDELSTALKPGCLYPLPVERDRPT